MAHVKQKNSGLWVPQSTHEKIDSQKIFIENMEQHETNYTELTERIHGKVDSITKLKALDVSSADSTIKSGTIVVVDGIGPYYYTLLSEEEADDEEIVAPNTGEGLWILSGGGGNLIVDEADYGEDTDSDQDRLILKIKKLFNKKTKTNFFPITTTKAVRDTTTKKTLFDILRFAPTIDESEEVVEGSLRDSDTLGGQLPSHYATAQGLSNISDSVGAEYDGKVPYVVGQFCVRGGKLYKCIAETTGDFTVEDWEEVSVADLISEMNNNVSNLPNIRVSAILDSNNNPLPPNAFMDNALSLGYAHGTLMGLNITTYIPILTMRWYETSESIRTVQMAFDGITTHTRYSVSPTEWGEWTASTISKNKMNIKVILNEYNSAYNVYTIPYDGYICAHCITIGKGTIVISGAEGNQVLYMGGASFSDQNPCYQSLFVKAGMHIYCSEFEGGMNAFYTPLE